MPKEKPSKSLFSEEYDRFLTLLREARVKAGLTQVEAAELLAKPQSFVSKCESGERRVDVIELTAFCRIYETSPTAFLRKLNQ